MDRKHRMASHRSLIDTRLTEMTASIDRAMSKAGIPHADREAFLEWIVGNSWSAFKELRMKRRIEIENEINLLGVHLPNGTVNKEYSVSFNLPVEKISDISLEGVDRLGLTFSVDEFGSCRLEGTPLLSGDFQLILHYSTIKGEPISAVALPVAFNPDPRSLWKDIPTDKDILYYKDDLDYKTVAGSGSAEEPRYKKVIAASRRGRSHAQEGKPRDDDFKIDYCEESEWFIIAVADGAGSAKYSRKGSEIACATAIDYCRERLNENPDFESSIREFEADRHNKEKRVSLTRKVIDIVYNGAMKAHKAIKDFADMEKGTRIKDFATTLMFVACKRFDFGWFIASFWVGDGALCILDTEKRTAKLLGTPDEGEFSGQTRFLTMQEIFRDPEIVAKRLRMAIVPDFSALLLMTDGVSDPLFGTENNLKSYEKWEEFYERLRNGFPEDGIAGVNPEASDADRQLLDWLNFWSQGNHDDRTIAILH